MRRNTLLLAFALAVCTAWAAAQMPGGNMGQQRPVPNDWPSAQQDKDSGQQRSDRDRDQDHNRAQDRDHDRNKQQAKVDDATLQREVHEQFASRGEFANVTVNVKDGVVRLDGSVPRKEDRKEAKKLAKSVPGVRGVREKLTISAAAGSAASSSTGAENTGGVSGAATGSSGAYGSTTGGSASAIGQSSTSQTSAYGSASSQPDTQTQMVIQNDLRNNSTLVQNNVVNNINVTATTNNIVISGTVPDQQTAEQVLAIAKARAGARQVVNNLTVSAAAASGAVSGQTGSTAGSAGAIGQSSTSQTTGASSQPDTQTQMAIQNDLRNNSVLVQNNIVNNINVAATTNNIVVSGKVPDQQTAEQVLAIAKAHAGPRQVVNNLTVSAAAVSGQTGSTAGTTGSMSGQAGASTSGQTGAMTGQTGRVSGQTGSTAGAVGAQAGTAQGQTGGLTTERNDLVGQIQTALRNEPTLANDNVMVNITDDTVELSGTAATGKEKQTAKRIAESYAGNRRVVDRITVTGRGRNENPGKGNQGNVPPPQQ